MIRIFTLDEAYSTIVIRVNALPEFLLGIALFALHGGIPSICGYLKEHNVQWYQYAGWRLRHLSVPISQRVQPEWDKALADLVVYCGVVRPNLWSLWCEGGLQSVVVCLLCIK